MTAHYQDLGNGIYCIDTALYRPQMAACYLIRQGEQVALVDTGTYYTVPLIMEVLADLGLSPSHVRYVMPTHVHLDHAGGAGELMAQCPNATLIVHPKGAPHMIDPSKLQAGATVVYGEAGFKQDYYALTAIPKERVIIAEEGQCFDLNGRTLAFYDTPGHANHHGCIFDQQSKTCFTGDTFGISYREFDTSLGMWLFAPTTPVAFSPDEWQVSLDKLEGLQPSAMCLTHYGQVSPALFPNVRKSIKELSALAYKHLEQSENRVAVLQEGILQLWLSQLAAHGCLLSPSESRELLAVDSDLNAQGLDVWLSRIAAGKASYTP